MNVPYPHEVLVLRPRDAATEDAYGRPTAAAPEELGPYPAWIQIRSAREQALLRAGGAEFGTYVIFVDVIDLRNTDALRDTTTLEEFELVGIRNPDGEDDHLEIDATLVKPVATREVV